MPIACLMNELLTPLNYPSLNRYARDKNKVLNKRNHYNHSQVENHIYSQISYSFHTLFVLE